ncbi:dipeptidase [Corynebacterium ciconiae]|uniref:dipeptidase n=1 Tax=Corynebacterium ciconiae TaxID=227319 RepID=UPI0004769511|nr:dipeptidase [Corynebacterium ciconiae]
MTTPDVARESVEKQKDRIFSDLSELCSFNSVHSVEELKDQHTAAGDWVQAALEKHGLDVTAYQTIDGTRTFIGTSTVDESAPTVLLYSHYDVVPAGDPAAWTSDAFTLTERDGRWYARGAADCKGNLVMHLAVLRTLSEIGGLSCNIKVVIEGSEERGGAGLDALIDERPELFAADAILIADSGNAAVGVPTLTTSLRGGALLNVKVDTLATAVHSGSFGGAAPDAVAALMRTLDSIRDEHGRTVIDGVDCTAKWQGMDYDRDTFRTDAGMLEGTEIMGTEEDSPADMLWARPAVSIIGFSSTPVSEAVNAVPATAEAQLNLRVPAGLDSAEVAEALKQHLINHTPWGAHVDVTVFDVNKPFSTAPESKTLSVLGEALSQAYGDKNTVVIGSGGSIPLTSKLQEKFPEAEIALFGVEEPSCTIHSPNESVDPEEILSIAVAETLFLQNYAK